MTPTPSSAREASTIERWAQAEEEGFGRTLAQGEKLLAELVERAKEEGTSWVSADDAFRLHDTYGFPYEMTRELLAEQGLSVDDQGFEELMERAREVSRGGAARAGGGDSGIAFPHEKVLRFAREAGFPSRFVGYEATEWETVLGALDNENGHLLAKLEESPFYPEGGGQVSDSGLVETPSGRARVVDVFRLGDDQALALEPVEGEIGPGRVGAGDRRAARPGSPRCATTPPPICCTPRCASGSAPTCARPARTWARTSCASTSPTATGCRRRSWPTSRTLVNGWIADAHGVRAIETTREEAEALGAMALFGEKYGDWVRMVEIEDVSRELCGGTHTATTAEVGLFHVAGEGSSASNVRRVEALTGRGRRRPVQGAQRGAARDRRPAAHAGDRGGPCRREGRGAAPRAEEEAGRPRPTRARRPTSWSVRPRRWAICGLSARRPTWPTRARCSASPTRFASGSATRRWCSARLPTGA